MTPKGVVFSMLGYLKRYCVLFLVGGAGYVAIEYLYRGKSHASMFLAGGLCVVLIRIICGRIRSRLLRLVAGGAIISLVELIFGIVFNLWLGMGVWDYSDMPLNILGQVCPYFSIAWAFLSIPALWVGNIVCGRHKLYKK